MSGLAHLTNQELERREKISGLILIVCFNAAFVYATIGKTYMKDYDRNTKAIPEAMLLATAIEAYRKNDQYCNERESRRSDS